MASSARSSSNSELGSAVADAKDRFARANPRSAELHRDARRFLPAGNTRSVLMYEPFPIAMQRGLDCRVWDVDGHQYLDLCGEYTAGLFGHSNDRILDAVRDALSNGVNLAAVGEAEGKLAELICSRFPSMELVRFANSGTEANLMAVTLARAFTGRERILGFSGGYHGSLLAFPVTGPSPMAAPFPIVRVDYNDTEAALSEIARNAGTLAAVIVEPMLGSGGCLPADPKFLAALRQATQEVGALLIFDEVMTSRMSSGGMQQRLGIIPDLTTIGKYIGGGMSFGAFGGRAHIMDMFVSSLPHSGTFNNNVLTMAAGRRALGEVFTAERAEELFQFGEEMRAALNAVLSQAGTSMHFEGLGSLATVHFRPGPAIRPTVPSAKETALRDLFFFDMLEAGIYLAKRGMIALSLPVSKVEIGLFVDAVKEFASVRRPFLPAPDEAA